MNQKMRMMRATSGVAVIGLLLAGAVEATGWRSPPSCEGGSSNPSTLAKTALPSTCKALVGEDGCGVTFKPWEESKSCETGGVEFSFSKNSDNSLKVSAVDGVTKISTVGFRSFPTDCLAAYASEPTVVDGVGVKRGEGDNYQEIKYAFACFKEDQTELKTNFDLPDSRVVDTENNCHCEPDEVFLGNRGNCRGVCVRCLGDLDPPDEKERICEGEDCLLPDIFFVGTFDTATKTGDPNAILCYPPGYEDDEFVDFRNCDEDIAGEDKGEERCVNVGADQLPPVGFQYQGNGSLVCRVQNGREVCRVR
jgi:hypothetical protein